MPSEDCFFTVQENFFEIYLRKCLQIIKTPLYLRSLLKNDVLSNAKGEEKKTKKRSDYASLYKAPIPNSGSGPYTKHTDLIGVHRST